MQSLLKLAAMGLVLFLIWGCQPSKLLSDAESPSSAETDSLDYTLVYLIHGDAEYLYHDEEGNGKEADQEKVKEAMEVAREAQKGEVFIFHQRPEKKVLWLFPQKDRRLYHYRNGELVQQKKYSPQSSDTSFIAEASFYHKFNSNTNRKILLYFGHEIPAEDIGYHASRPNAYFNINTFSDGIASFLNNGEVFDLTVLSTCDNGTPDMASKMAAYSNSMLASPKNLHLSHIDSDSLLKLEQDAELAESQLAESIAATTYQRLNEFLQTELTLSIYDLQQIQADLKLLEETYQEYRKTGSGDSLKSVGSLERENTDCATLPFWDNISTPEVKAVYYNPPRFGKKPHEDTFSGWGCEK